MIVKFNSLDRTEKPIFTLCNPGSTYTDGRLTNIVGILPNHEAEECVFNFNETSELNFRIYNTPLEDETADEYSKAMYDAVKNKRLIFMEDIGYFIIDDVNEQYDNDGKEYKDVSAKSIDAELQQRNIPYIADGTYRFSTHGTTKGIFETIMETIPLWTIGEVDSTIAEKYRTFEDVDTSLNCLGFMIENLQEAYECIILFDTINRVVNVYDQANYVHLTSVHLTKNDVINSLKITEHSDDLYTAITVSGEDDVLIADVNPLGANTIYNFDYYLDWMTSGLKTKVIAWQTAINSAKSNYYQLNLSRYNLRKSASDLTNDIDKLNIQIKIYNSCRDNIVGDQSTNIVESGNAELQKYGGTPITITGEIDDVVDEIEGLIADCETEKSSKQAQLTTVSGQIEAIESQLTTIINNLSFTSNFTTSELEELANYIFEGTYKDEYVVITDIMDYSEKFEQMKILYDRAESQLEKVSVPTQEFDIDTENILFQKEFEHAGAQLETGCLINVEVKDGDVAELFLSCIKVNYDDYSLSMTFGNRYNKFDPKTLFNSVLGSVSKSANTLGFIKDTIYPIKQGALNLMATEIQNARDLTMAGALASDSEEVVIDSTGYTGRRKNQNTGEFDPEQIKITNNNIVFTDDSWDTSKLAIGRIVLGENTSIYGVNAEALIGNIIIGNELHIKDSQGQDIMTVIDGRISTEVTEVKSAAASGTYEYYDPNDSSWSEKNNVDFFGYGISQDQTETDTGVKAADNPNKYFLDKHIGNLYKSNGTKWVFQKTLSPKFNNYSTIAYTDGKASTAESNAKTYAEGQASTAESNAKTYAEGQASAAQTNAINNAAQQVNNAKATIASSTLKYDETGITVTYYGYGTPTEITGAEIGDVYLDQNDGFYYTKGSGSTWTKSSTALPLYADQKATEAYNNALSYVATYYITSADATTSITQTKQEIEMTAAKAVSKYEVPAGITINFAGYGDPTTQGAVATATNQYYLDQETGNLYKSNSSKQWGSTPTQTLTLITNNLDSKIDQTAESITQTVSATYSTKQETATAKSEAISAASDDATAKANTAKSEAISAASTDATTKANNAKSEAISTASADATSKANTAKSEAISTASADATSKANTAQANAISAAATDATNKANAARDAAIADTDNKLLSYSTTTQMNTKIDETAGHIISEANARLEATVGYSTKNVLEITLDSKTVNGITYTVDKAAGTISVNGTATKQSQFSVPISPDLSGNFYFSGCPAGGGSQKYDLYAWDKTTGARVKKWDGVTNCVSDYGETSQEIKLIQGHESQLTIRVQNGVTVSNLVFGLMIRDGSFADDSTFEPYRSVQTQFSEANSKIVQTAHGITQTVAAANAVEYIIPSGTTVHYHGYGFAVVDGQIDYTVTDTGISAVGNSGKRFLNQSDGMLYVSDGTTWNNSSKQQLSERFSEYSTSAQTTSEINQTANSVTLSVLSTTAGAMGKYDETGVTINFYGYGVPTTVSGSSQGSTYLDQKTGYVYTRGSGETSWTKTSELTLDTTAKANAAENNAKTYAEGQASAAESNAKDYVDGELTHYTTTTDMNTTIDSKVNVAREAVTLESKSLVEATVGYMNKNLIPVTMNSGTYTTSGANLTYTVDKTAGTITFNGTSRTDTSNINLNFYTDSTGSISGNYYITGGYSSNCAIRVYDDTTGAKAWCKKWDGTTSMDSSTSGTNSQEVKLVSGHKNLFRVVIKPNVTLTNAVVRPMLRVPDITDTTFVPYKSTVQRQIDDTNASIVVESNRITSTVASAMNKYDTTGLTIDFYGYGVPTTVSGSSQGSVYLDQETGYVYTRGSGETSWTKTSELTLYTEKMGSQIAQTASEISLAAYATVGQGVPVAFNPIMESKTVNGITFTKQLDGSYLINGTNEVSGGSRVYISTTDGTEHASISDNAIKTNGTYVIKATGDDDIAVGMYIYTQGNIPAYGSHDAVVEITNAATGRNAVWIGVNAGTYNNVRIYPVIYLQSDEDKTLESNLCSIISARPEAITLSTTGRLIITSGNFQVDASGNVTATNASLTGGVIQTTNYSAASGNTKTVGGKINLAATGNTLLFDTANFKITGGGSITAEGVNLNSCNINGGTIQILSSSEATRDSFMMLQSGYKGTDNKYYNYFMNVSPYQITHQYTKYSGATSSTAIDTRDIIYLGNNGNITILNTYLNGQSSSKQTSIGAGTVTTEDLFVQKLYTSRTDGRIISYDSLHFANGTGIMLSDKRMAFTLYNNEVAVGIDTLPIRIYATAAYTPSAWVVSSDARQKQNIEALDERYLDIVKSIEPKRFRYINRPLDRYHTGYIAQDVKEAMDEVGVDTEELSAFVDVKGDNSDLALRYEEFIPLLHKWLQELDSRLSALEKKGE